MAEELESLPLPLPLPLVVLHRYPSFKLSIFSYLHSNYTLLDQPSVSKSARVMLCVGPTPVTTADLDRYPSLECIIGSSAGIDHLDLSACRTRGIRVTAAGDSFSDDVADYALALSIDVMRRISAANRFLRQASWPATRQDDYALGSKVSGKRVGILGLGSIGSRVAKRFEAFGCTIAYNSRKTKPHLPYPYYANLTDLASNVDILIVCCALTDETYHLVNKDVMAALGKMGIVVNVGRGALIDEKELVQFLVRGEIGGAGLDVFEHEPHVPPELLTLDNVVLSPHKAVLTPESFAALGELIISNLDAFFSNKPLQAEIKFD